MTPFADRATGRISLRTRVALLAAICVGATVALVSLGGYLTVRTSLYSQVDDTLLQRAEGLRDSLRQAERLQDIPTAIVSVADLRVAVIDLGSGQVLARGEMRLDDEDFAVAAGQAELALHTDERHGLRVVTLPAGPGAAVSVGQPLHTTRAVLGRLGLVFGLVGGSGVLLAAIAGTAVARAGLRPVQRLTAATEHIGRTGELTPIPISGDDELARLTRSFNSMLDALAESRERQRRLVADAGHELRTPLTSLRTNLDLLVASSRPDAPPLDEQDRAELYADVRAQVAELTTLVGDLVELAREDAPQEVHEPVDLVEVIERALDRARRRAPSVTFARTLTPWTLLGDANALERAVLNLLDNAAKWSPPGGTVRVTLIRLVDTGVADRAAAHTAALQVADFGPGIAEADLSLVFERFYRSTDARTLPGSGLGLAIVKQVAERHGGGVRAETAPGGGALLTMLLPGLSPGQPPGPAQPAAPNHG